MSGAHENLEKLPPQNLEAEQSVLGAALIDSAALLKVLDIISENDFYRDAHRKVWRALVDLFDKSDAADLVTVAEALAKRNELDAVGGPAYLGQLAAQVPTSANIKYHARIVREKALLRALLRSSTEIASRVYEDSEEAEVLLDEAEKSIFEISDRRMRSAFSSMKDVIHDSFKMIEELFERKETITGLPTGFRDLDTMTSGLQKGDLVVVGGRPSMGKTAFALNIAQHAGIETNEPVAIFSLEMSTQQLVLRMLCSEARVDSNNVRKGFLKDQDWHKLTAAAGRLSEAPIFIDDSTNSTVLEMRAKARRLKMEHGLSLIIIDYLQLMRGRTTFESRVQEISDITRSLKGLAKELEVPVIALSQLNRGLESRTDKRPNLADLRESGAIEQDADVIIFLYRDEVYTRRGMEEKDKFRPREYVSGNEPDNKGVAELIVAKQRNGPIGTVKTTFLSYCTRFVDAAQGHYMEDESPVDEESPF